jgi:hypothetical protein
MCVHGGEPTPYQCTYLNTHITCTCMGACVHTYILTYIHTSIPVYIHNSRIKIGSAYIACRGRPTYTTYIHIHTYIHTIHTYIKQAVLLLLVVSDMFANVPLTALYTPLHPEAVYVNHTYATSYVEECECMCWCISFGCVYVFVYTHIHT